MNQAYLPCPTARSFEYRIGSRKIYAHMNSSGTCTVLADCDVFPGACVTFTIPGEAALIFFENDRQNRPATQDLFPDLRPEHRDILITGNSPAEFDQMHGIPMPETEEEFKLKYAPLGYTFEE